MPHETVSGWPINVELNFIWFILVTEQCFTKNYKRQKLGLELIIIVALLLLILRKWDDEWVFTKHVPCLCQALCWLFYYHPHFRLRKVDLKRNWLAVQARNLKNGFVGEGGSVSVPSLSMSASSLEFLKQFPFLCERLIFAKCNYNITMMQQPEN